MSATTPEAYLAELSPEQRATLEKVRDAIRAAAPDAEEGMRYGMPCFIQGKAIAGYAASAKHCSYHPMSGTVVASMGDALTSYETSKGTIRFPIGKPPSKALIRKLVKTRLAEVGSPGAPRAKQRAQPQAATIDAAILAYNQARDSPYTDVCSLLATEIAKALPDAVNKVWHGHPVWFLGDNPIVGYSQEKPGIRLMFWSGADFEEPGLNVLGKKFKDASVFYNAVTDVDTKALRRWLKKSQAIQWDYANIRKNRGLLQRPK